jgi:hypothetical protein
MGAAEIIALAGTLLGGAGEVAKLAAQALDALRAQDDAKALALLDQAIAKQQADAAAAAAELAAVRARISAAIDAKFGAAT